MKYRFYKWEDGQKWYVVGRSRGTVFMSNPKRADLLTEADWLAWGGPKGLEREEVGEDELMRLAGAPMLPGMGE